jgi:hypothetical protein
MKVRDKFSRDQLRWSDISWGEVDGDWPAISFARGTGAFSPGNAAATSPSACGVLSRRMPWPQIGIEAD